MQWRFPLKFGRTGRPVTVNDECDEIDPLLSLYSDGMTSPAETRRVEAHLADCESCRKAHFWMRATYEVISHRPTVMPPPDMASRIQRAIAEADGAAIPGVAVRLRFNPSPAYAMAAALLIAAVVVARLGHGSGPVNVAVNRPLTANSTSSTTPILPAPSVIVKRAPLVTHPPVNVANASHEVASPVVHEHVPVLARHDGDVELVVHHPISHTQTMLASNRTSAPPTIHHTAIQMSHDTHVARDTPERLSTHVDSMSHVIAPQPAPPPVVSPTHDDQVATSTTHDDVPVAVSPPTAPVVMAAADTHRGLNAYLRDAVESIRPERADSTVHSRMVVATEKEISPSIGIVGTTSPE